MQLLPLIHITRNVWAGVIALMLFSGLGECFTYPARQLQSQPFRVVWDKQYGNDAYWNEYRVMAVGKNSEIVIGVTARNLTDAKESANRLLLWRMDQKGQITNETEIVDPQRSTNIAAKNSITAAIKDLLILENGDALLVVEFEPGHPSIVRVNSSGQQTLTKNLTDPNRRVVLLRMISTSDGKFLLFGHESFDAVAMKVDANGNVLWERKHDHGMMDLFVDGTVSDDGGFILVGNSGNYNALRGGPSVVWVGQYDSKGELKAKTTFEGRYGRVARSEEGGYGVVYDRADSESQDIRLKVFTPDLKELRETRLLAVTPSFLDFKIAAAIGGGFLVTGGKEGKLYLTRINQKGESIATFQDDATNPSIDIGNYGVLVEGSDVLVASSNIDLRDRANARRKVRMRRIVV